MESFDRTIVDLMTRRSTPGGAVAATKNGHLVLARGYGMADVKHNQPVQPDSLFGITTRIANVANDAVAATCENSGTEVMIVVT
jgi:hypothetical protein